MKAVKDPMDLAFSALADSSRRKMIEQLHEGDCSILELSRSFSGDMSFQAVSKHVKILEEAGIVSKQKKGKYRICSLNRGSFQDSLKWISFYSDFWNESLDQLARLIREQSPKESP